MKILGICGSPRAGGNTDTLLDKFLEGAAYKGAVTEKIILEKMNIHPCGEKEYTEINERGFSTINDDMSFIYDKILACDCIVAATPIFFGSVSAQMKAMVDRFQCVWLAKNKKNIEIFNRKIKGVFLCVAASDRVDFFENARSIVKHFFATVKADYTGEIYIPGVEEKGDVLKHPERLSEAYELGVKITEE